jgi:hypothetical protein
MGSSFQRYALFQPFQSIYKTIEWTYCEQKALEALNPLEQLERLELLQRLELPLGNFLPLSGL